MGITAVVCQAFSTVGIRKPGSYQGTSIMSTRMLGCQGTCSIDIRTAAPQVSRAAVCQAINTMGIGTTECQGTSTIGIRPLRCLGTAVPEHQQNGHQDSRTLGCQETETSR